MSWRWWVLLANGSTMLWCMVHLKLHSEHFNHQKFGHVVWICLQGGKAVFLAVSNVIHQAFQDLRSDSDGAVKCKRVLPTMALSPISKSLLHTLLKGTNFILLLCEANLVKLYQSNKDGIWIASNFWFLNFYEC